MKVQWHLAVVLGYLISTPVMAHLEKHEIFQNLYSEPQEKPQSSDNEQRGAFWKTLQEEIRSVLALQVNPNMHIGIDKFKSGPLKGEESEIISVSSHLQPKGSDAATHRGYGIEFRVKLD